MVKGRTEQAVKSTLCVHYWMIAPPNGGRTSLGRCKVCGEKKDFLNSMNDSKWPGKRNRNPRL